MRLRLSVISLIVLISSVFAPSCRAEGAAAPDPDSNYTIHALMRFMNPIDVPAMNDGRQIVTIVHAGEEYTDVNCTLFPLLVPQVKSDPHWRADDKAMEQYIRPGLTANWDARMRNDLLAALKSDGIDADALDDKALVENVSKWLLHRSNSIDMFDTWFVDFPGGSPRILPGLEDAFREPHNLGDPTWSTQQQFEHELLGRSMFYNRCFGSCTSYAIYQATVMRALGIPTRIFLTSPLIDGGSGAQQDMLAHNIHHHLVATTVQQGMEGIHGFANHTYNEVYVGGVWTTLNYDRLGQPMLDKNYYGLMVHINTLADWSDGNYAATWGSAYAQQDRPFIPYATLDLWDEFGKNAHIDNPPVEDTTPKTVTVSRAYWQSDPNRPANVPAPATAGSGDLMLHVTNTDLVRDYRRLKEFMRRSGRDFLLQAPGQKPVTAHVTLGSVTSTPDVCEIFLSIPTADYDAMPAGVTYFLKLPADTDGYAWKQTADINITKPIK
jgi:hypothetical protein